MGRMCRKPKKLQITKQKNKKTKTKMINILILLSKNNFFEDNIYLCGGIILGCTLLYLIKSNYTVIHIKNKEAFTNQEIEAIINENAVTVINNEKIDAITDNDFDTDVNSISTYDNGSLFDSATSSDFYDIISDPDIAWIPSSVTNWYSSEPFIMPDVDFNVCSIEELKLFELSSIFSREMEEHSISEEDLIGLIKRFPKKDLTTNWINDLILKLIEQV